MYMYTLCYLKEIKVFSRLAKAPDYTLLQPRSQRSLLFLPPSLAPGGGRRREPGNEIDSALAEGAFCRIILQPGTF